MYKNFKVIETSLEKLKDDIKNFYDPSKYHFITINAIDFGNGKVNLKYFFSKYDTMEEPIAFSLDVTYEDTIPTITDIIPSAWISEAELADLFGLKIEGAQKGLFLEPDSPPAPLRRS